MLYGIPGHCYSIDGELWHEIGSCIHGNGKPCCYETKEKGVA